MLFYIICLGHPELIVHENFFLCCCFFSDKIGLFPYVKTKHQEAKKKEF